jgi:anaerobic magnesium-protoporphyrin IX monomethyl ester cyclase
MSKVTIIRPPSVTAKWVPALIATPPLAAAYLASTLVKEGHDVQIIDSVGEALNQKTIFNDTFAIYGLTAEEIAERIDEDTQVIGVSSMFTQDWPHVKHLCQYLKKAFPNALMLVGGEHPSAEPIYTLTNCPEIDLCCQGEGEETFSELLKKIDEGEPYQGIAGLVYRAEDGEIVIGPRRKRIRTMDEIPWPSWDLAPIENYLDEGLGFGVKRGRSMPMLLSRGCPYLCTFCSNPTMWTNTWTVRDHVDAVDEIEYYVKKYGVQNIDFYDLTAVVRKKWMRDFCNLLIERKLNITWQLPSGTRSEAIDKELSTLLYQSGCRNMSYSPESGSPSVLKKIKKKITPDSMIKSMKGAVESNINTKFNIIFGFPGETHFEIFQTFLFIIRCAFIGVHDMAIWLFVPYPGSELFNQVRSEGKLKFDDDYFVSLSVYSDYANSMSWNDNMGPKMLKFYRLSGSLIFYIFAYLFRPMRIYYTIRNLRSGQHESRLETVLAAFYDRMFKPVNSNNSSEAV